MLIYLWIEEYGCFRNQGFSFSPEYDIAFDKNTKQISVYKKKASIGTLVYGESLSLTAIVGNNGAGKSTLLDLIREFLFDSEQLSKKRPGFFIMKGDSSEKPLLVYNLTNTRLKSDSRLISMNHPLPCNNPGGSLPNLIYYSALPEEKYYLHGFDDHQDLPGSGESSENSLIGYWGQNELRSWRQYNLSFSGLLKEASDTVNPFLTCFHQDIRRQISFYGKIKEKEHYRDYIPFPLPDKLTISIDILDLDDFDRVLDDYLESYEYMGMRHKGEHNTKSFTVGLLKELKEIHEKLFGQLNNVTVLPTQLLQWDLFLSVLYNLLYQRKYLIGANVDDYSKIDNLLTPYFSPFPDFTHIFESIEHFFIAKTMNTLLNS